jgi:hypothetical protein
LFWGQSKASTIAVDSLAVERHRTLCPSRPQEPCCLDINSFGSKPLELEAASGLPYLRASFWGEAGINMCVGGMSDWFNGNCPSRDMGELR